jgi:hypothetical protein
MSGKQMGRVFELDLPHEQAWILVALADNAHDDGSRCFPSVQRLAWKTGYGERQVQRIMLRLRELGYVEAVEFARGGRQATEYQLHLDRPPEKPDFAVKKPGRPPNNPDILTRDRDQSPDILTENSDGAAINPDISSINRDMAESNLSPNRYNRPGNRQTRTAHEPSNPLSPPKGEQNGGRYERRGRRRRTPIGGPLVPVISR